MSNTTRPPTNAWGRQTASKEPTNAFGRPLTEEQQKSRAAAEERQEREKKDLASIVESRIKLGDSPDQARRYADSYAATEHSRNSDLLVSCQVDS